MVGLLSKCYWQATIYSIYRNNALCQAICALFTIYFNYFTGVFVMTINEKIFKLIEDKGITSYRLAKEIGVSMGHIGDWKSGRSSPTSERVVKIAKYFGVSTDYLLGLTDNPMPHYE